MLLEELRNELSEEKAEHSRTMALLREAVFNVNELSSRPPQAAEEIRVINGKNKYYMLMGENGIYPRRNLYVLCTNCFYPTYFIDNTYC